jgi:hypothetical protein
MGRVASRWRQANCCAFVAPHFKVMILLTQTEKLHFDLLSTLRALPPKHGGLGRHWTFYQEERHGSPVDLSQFLKLAEARFTFTVLKIGQ